MINIIKKHKKNNSFSSAFTIIELLIVIAVIGILATISIVSYPRIRDKVTEATIKSQLTSAADNLKSFRNKNGNYPVTIDCSIADSGVNLCLEPGDDVSYTYRVDDDSNPQSFTLYATSLINSKIYSITYSSTVSEVSEIPEIPEKSITCPTGFIIVPGSSTYGTDDFCVMKYEAKADDNNDGIGDTTQTTGYNTWPANTYPISSSRKLVSSAAGYPVANISQTTAINAAANYTADQSGNTIDNTHLITEAEWMTIAQNVLSVDSNWSGGAVGSGYIYSGHNDNSPANALVASTNDGDGYYGTGNTSGNQRRTLTLTNGEVIWDIVGNVYDWTSGQTTGGQPGVPGSGWAWHQYPELTTPGSLSVNILPSSTGLPGADSWTSSNGIGQIYSNADDTAARVFLRGGGWNFGGNAGVLTLRLDISPSSTAASVGFRVSR